MFYRLAELLVVLRLSEIGSAIAN